MVKIRCDNLTEMANWRQEALELQQEFCEKLGDRLWDKIKCHERWALESKVGFALFGEPRDASQVDHNGYSLKQRKEIKRMCDIIIKVACTSNINIGFLFVVGKSEYGFFIVPVFRVQRFEDYHINVRPRIYSCFIDDHGRVYENWRDYTENNKLPESEVLYPRNGVYETDWNGKVLVTYAESPASSTTAKALAVGDTGAAIVSGLLAGVGLASIFIPVVGPIAAAVTWGSAGCGLYGLSRGSYFLHDRRVHGQSISLENGEARNCWLSVLGSALGVGSGLAMKGMVRVVAQGQAVGRAGTIAVNMLNFSSLTVNGIGVANNLANLVEKKNNDELTTLDVLQFTSSVLFFTNAAMNVKTASSIIEQVQKDTPSNFSAALKQRITRNFNKLVGRPVNNRAQMIKEITKVRSKDEFFKVSVGAFENMARKSIDVTTEDGAQIISHVTNNSSNSIASAMFTFQNNIGLNNILMVVTNKMIEKICIEMGKEFVVLFNGTVLELKDLFDDFAILLNKYFSLKETSTFPSEKISDLIIHCERFAREKGCRTKEDFIDFTRFICIYERSRMKDLKYRYLRQKVRSRKLLGDAFNETSFNLKWGIKDANDKERSFLRIINDELKISNDDLKKKFEMYNKEIPLINACGVLKFRSNYNALNEFYHSFVIDGEELSPSEFFDVIRQLADNETCRLSDADDPHHSNSRLVTYSDEGGAVLVTVEESQEGRFLKSVSLGKKGQFN